MTAGEIVAECTESIRDERVRIEFPLALIAIPASRPECAVSPRDAAQRDWDADSFFRGRLETILRPDRA